MTNTKHLIKFVTDLCTEVEELRALVNTVPEQAELQKMRERVREHDQTVRKLHDAWRELEIYRRALELAAIEKYYRLTDEQQDKLKQHDGREPWYEFEYSWRCKAEDDIDDNDWEGR